MPSLLIVDDELHIRRGLSCSINWKAYGVDDIYTASNGMDAIQTVKTHSVDLVITDVRMPDMTGLEMIRRIKVLSPHIKFIVISGHAEFDFAKEALHLRVSEYLLKPVNICELIHLVQDALDLRVSAATDEQAKATAAAARSGNQMVSRVIAYIQSNYRSPISLTELGKEMERNPSYISYIFHKETGKKFVDYINEVRIEHALKLIETSNLMLYEIASMVGFTDYRQFTRAFKKLAGCSPTEYLANSATPGRQEE